MNRKKKTNTKKLKKQTKTKNKTKQKHKKQQQQQKRKQKQNKKQKTKKKTKKKEVEGNMLLEFLRENYDLLWNSFETNFWVIKCDRSFCWKCESVLAWENPSMDRVSWEWVHRIG